LQNFDLTRTAAADLDLALVRLAVATTYTKCCSFSGTIACSGSISA
jgi:hypothetical protein